MSMDYFAAYGRNIGLFTKEQQEMLRVSQIAIAGVGGVGGIQAVTLARFGVGEMSIVDPGFFDEPDLNRQYGAQKSTLGRNKAVVIGEMLRVINPFVKVNVYEKAMCTEQELSNFINGATLAIDAIDYMGFDHKAMFAEAARKKGVYNLSAPIPDFGSLLMIFDPHGMTLEEFLGAPANKDEYASYRPPIEKFVGCEGRSNNLKVFLEGTTNFISTNAGAACASGALLATEAAFIITGIRKAEDIVRVPNVLYLDLLGRELKVINPFDETT